MSATEHARFPLVFGSRRATEDAARLLPGLIIENRVTARIGEGAVSHEPRDGGVATVDLGEGLVGLVRRTRSPSGRKAWRLIGVSNEDRRR